MRAQIFSIDMIIAIVPVVISTLVLFSVILYVQERDVISSKMEIFEKANELADYMVYYPGVPINWNISTVVVLGLADKYLQLSKKKINMLNNMSYEKLKNIFDLNTFHLTLKYPNSTVIIEKGVVNTNKSVLKIKRFAFLNGNVVEVSLDVFY